ncbi:hypothetical protein [Haloglomus litoreum]|uniref:hypothetical protein n=1 Tax=Haloglomus litoreum TaxID=3034026 RepID=UPI0023E7AE29|nr:hypothetical protein [Haloglomus sp. DT116]
MRTSALVVAALSLAAVVVAGGAAAGGASSTPHDNGIGLNYTVGLPNDQSHQPGADSADIRHYAAANGLFEETSSPDGFERMDTLTIYSQDVLFGTCSTENTKAFGIDRDDDSPGTKTDEGLLSHRENSAFNEHSIYVDFYGGDSLAGEPVSLQDEDQVVAAQTGCYGMPDEPGWYQINARINGTGYNGNYIDTDDQGTVRSHYFYICECSSEQEAREKLGPPPSDEGSGEDPDDGSSTATPTATPEPTATESTGDSSGSSTATATATPEPTATATTTPTATATPTATTTDTSTDGGASAGGGGGAGGGAAGQTATVTATAGADANTGGGGQQTQQQTAQQADGPGTPTAGAGPGFGLVAALGGVLAVALLALRRD